MRPKYGYLTKLSPTPFLRIIADKRRAHERLHVTFFVKWFVVDYMLVGCCAKMPDNR